MTEIHVFNSWQEARALGWGHGGRHPEHPDWRFLPVQAQPAQVKGLRADRVVVHNCHVPTPLLQELRLVIRYGGEILTVYE